MKERLVIIPTYNEIENIEPIIRKVFSLSLPFDILIVDDGSPDGTAEKVMELQSVFPQRLHLEQRTGKLGLGTAYLLGFRKALDWGYKYAFEMDADFSHNPEDLIRLYAACAEEGNDLSVGSRYVKGVNVVNWPMSRVLLSYGASWYVRFITGMPIADPTAGFKCYHRSVLETIDLARIRFVGYAFQIEMKFKAWKYGFKIVEVPIIFTERTRGTSKMSTKIIQEAFWGVIQLKVKSFFRTFQR